MNRQDQDLAIEEFCRREYAGLYRYVYAFVGNKDDALEVTQESFLRFHRLWSEGKVRKHERALLFRLGRNVAVDLFRNRSATPAQETQPNKVVSIAQPRQPTPEEILLENERQQCAEQALARLGQKERECLELRSGGLSYREVAAALQLNPNTVGPTVARALQRFREAYVELLENKNKAHWRGIARRW